jgi:putative phage-type endonuclease
MLAADPVDLTPGSAEWMGAMTASKVAAVVGLSPYVSHFTLWHVLAGNLPPDDAQTPAQRRGHLLEDAVAQYVAEEHGLHLVPGGSWRNRDRPWQAATPDRLSVDLAYPAQLDHLGAPGHRPICDAVVECKTAADFEDWGPDRTDQVPAYVRAQVLWQLDTLGLQRGYVGVLLPYLSFRSYVIEANPGEADWLREQAVAFLATVADGIEPDIDTHGSTYPTLRQLHPDIEQRTVDVDAALADRYVSAVLALRAAKREEAAAKTLIAHAMGNARSAVHATTGVLIARRESKNGGLPYVKAADNPIITPTEEIL